MTCLTGDSVVAALATLPRLLEGAVANAMNTAPTFDQIIASLDTGTQTSGRSSDAEMATAPEQDAAAPPALPAPLVIAAGVVTEPGPDPTQWPKAPRRPSERAGGDAIDTQTAAISSPPLAPVSSAPPSLLGLVAVIKLEPAPPPDVRGAEGCAPPAGAPISDARAPITADEPEARDAQTPDFAALTAPVRPSHGTTAEPVAVLRLHVSGLVTHLPVAVANMLPTPANLVASTARPGAEATGPAVAPPKPQMGGEPVKIVRFELEPAALGGLTVKMRLSETRVEIEIGAQSASTANLLTDARDALSTAIEHKGFVLHAFEVTTRGPTEPAGVSMGTRSEHRNGDFGGESGSFNGQHPGEGERHSPPSRGKRREEKPDASPAPVLAGLVL